jgi:uncharacterized membrane protein
MGVGICHSHLLSVLFSRREIPMTHHDEPIPSKAAIAGHPIHPMLIPFPVTFLVAALVTDILYMNTGDTFWSRTSLWVIGAGVATALFAALFGLTDFLSRQRIREHSMAWWHMGLNVTATVLSGINFYMRFVNGEQVIIPLGIALSAAVAGILVVSGWLGGEMSYKHKIGVAPDDGDAEPRRAYTAGD